MEACSRRSFLRGAGITAAAFAAGASISMAKAPKSPFKIAVINDEISQDFDHVCYVVSHDFGLSWIELRSMWGKNIMDLGDDQIAEARKILAKYNLEVTDIASPLFKTDWPDAPISKFSTTGDMHGAVHIAFKKQDEILDHAIALAKQFKTDKVRCFDFGAPRRYCPLSRGYE